MKSIIRNYIFILISSLLFLSLSACDSKTDNLSIKAYDANDMLLAESVSKVTDGIVSAEMLLEREYQQGDYLVIQGAQYLNIQLDENIRSSDIYAPNGRFNFPIPFKENGNNYSPESYTGKQHQIVVKHSQKEHLSKYRNLALNTFDIRGESDFYPHATSNSEYKEMSIFAAINAIDGNVLNTKHGYWPFQSWGPHKKDSLWFKIEFGREVSVNKLVIVNRAEYEKEHDSYWEQVRAEFADGTSELIQIGETHLPQKIEIPTHNTSWIKFSEFRGHKDLWNSWIELEVWGNDK